MARSWPPYRTVRALVHAHLGKPAVILGGGDSIRKHIDACPIDAIYISVNDHGCRLLKDRPKLAPRACSYVVACDKIEERARADVGRSREDIACRPPDRKPWGLPVISRHCWADYRLTFMPAPSSGMSAAWLARLMGCAPIILTGMDLYAGATYFDDPKAKSTGHTITDAQHFRRWTTLLDRYPAQYRTAGCHPLLQQRCAHYDPNEPTARTTPVDKLIQEIESAWCRLTRDALIDMRPFNADDVLELHVGEVDRLVKQKKAVRVKPGEHQ